MVQIKISQELELKLQDLIFILWENEYFGFLESAEDYVNRIFDFISQINNKTQFKCKNKANGGVLR
jgi:hypothetical protein